MNFLCEQCKQKYHVADEKLRGRSTARFKCKKCEHITEIRIAGATASAADSEVTELSSSAMVIPPASVHPPAPAPTASVPRPLSGPSSAVPRAPTGAALPTAAARATSALPARQPTGTALPTAAARAASRQPTGTSLPVAPSAVRPSVAPRPITGGVPATAPRQPAGALPARQPTSTGLPTASARAASSASSPLRGSLGTKPGEPSVRPSASALLNATETGWYAGVRDLPVGPLTRSEMIAKIEVGDITPDTLVWREGLDDWRPLRNVQELSDLLRMAAQKMSGELLGTMGRRESPASSAKVVPLARPANKAAPSDEDAAFGDDDDEPTRMTSLEELVAKADAYNTAKKADAKAASPAPAGSTPAIGPSHSAKDPVPAPSSVPISPSSGAAKPAEAKPAEAKPAEAKPAEAKPAEHVVASAPPASPSVDAKGREAGAGDESLGALTAAPLVPPVSAASSSASSASVTATPVREESRRGLPLGVWIMMVGVGVAGVAVGLVLRPSSRPAPPPVASTVQPARSEPPSTLRTTAAQITVPENLPPPVQEPTATPVAAPPASAPAAASAQPVTLSRASAGGTRVPVGSGSGNAGGTRNSVAAQQRAAALNAAFGDMPIGGPAPAGPVSSGLRNALPAPEDSNNGPTGAARAQQVLQTLHRSGIIRDCWNTALRRNPAHPAEDITVTLDVNPIGRARVSVRGAQDPDLQRCIVQRAGSAMYGAGGSVTAEAPAHLTPGS